MKLDRTKLIEQNKNTLEKEYLDMLDKLSDYEICKYMLWDRVHSIIHELTSKIQSNISAFILCVQIGALITKIIVENRNLSSETLNKATIITRTIIFIGLIINTVIQLLITRFRVKTVNNLKVINEYSDLIKDTVIEEINQLKEK